MADCLGGNPSSFTTVLAREVSTTLLAFLGFLKITYYIGLSI